MIACRMLGPVEISVDGAAPPAELLWRKHLALLVYLARSPRRTRSREHLVGVLWGDRPQAAARHSLREAVRVLRRCAGRDGVDTAGEQIRVADHALDLDVDRFETLAAAGDWRNAAELAAGEFLEGFGVPDSPAFEDWLAAERLGWRRRSVEVLVRRAEELLRSGHPADGTEYARRALTLDPVSNAAARAIVSALAIAGERAAALEVYGAFAAHLAQEVDTEPEAATRALMERVRRERSWRLPAGEDAQARRGAESRRVPLAGRERELADLLARWDACRAARRATAAIVDGDPGVGKSRLAEEVGARARLDGAATGAVRAVQADTGEAWSGVYGLARGGLLDASGIGAAAPEALAAFASRLAEWGDRFAGARRSTPLSPGAALSEVLRAACDEQAVLLVVDDAHWLDRESLQALGGTVRDLAQSPLFLLLTAAAHPPREELDELRTRIDRELPGVVVHLKPLALEPLRALARWALPAYSEAELNRVTRRIATDSAGLPLLAVELLHAVALGLDLHRTAGAWPEERRTLDQTLPGDLPDAVVAAIRIGYRRLSRDAQTALAVASVLGERVDRTLLARASGLHDDQLAAALDELEWQRWLTAESRGYAFLARVVRDVVAKDMLTPGQRQRVLDAARA